LITCPPPASTVTPHPHGRKIPRRRILVPSAMEFLTSHSGTGQ
jgi:hypothetical protein